LSCNIFLLTLLFFNSSSLFVDVRLQWKLIFVWVTLIIGMIFMMIFMMILFFFFLWFTVITLSLFNFLIIMINFWRNHRIINFILMIMSDALRCYCLFLWWLVWLTDIKSWCFNFFIANYSWILSVEIFLRLLWLYIFLWLFTLTRKRDLLWLTRGGLFINADLSIIFWLYILG
jgi:hypothetical protein